MRSPLVAGGARSSGGRVPVLGRAQASGMAETCATAAVSGVRTAQRRRTDCVSRLCDGSGQYRRVTVGPDLSLLDDAPDATFRRNLAPLIRQRDPVVIHAAERTRSPEFTGHTPLPPDPGRPIAAWLVYGQQRHESKNSPVSSIPTGHTGRSSHSHVVCSGRAS